MFQPNLLDSMGDSKGVRAWNWQVRGRVAGFSKASAGSSLSQNGLSIF